MHNKMKRALLLIDLQNDFMPGGALAVPAGDAVVAVANQVMPLFELVVATKDWHPANHGSFASQHSGSTIGDVIDLNGMRQILWPDHCVQNTTGAELVASLNARRIDKVFPKGMDRGVDSYSGFFDNGHRNSTGLADFLKQQNVDEITIMGLATDYCVKFTALDARALGFTTRLLMEGVRGVEIHTGDCEKAIAEMRDAGVEIATHADCGVSY